MKAMRKTLAIVVGILFLANNFSFSIPLDTTNITQENLAGESRLAPLKTQELLDGMKLAAELKYMLSKEKLEDLVRNKTRKMEVRDTITAETGPGGLRRDGDELVFLFRNSKPIQNSTYLPAYIKGSEHSDDTETSKRLYLFRITEPTPGEYDLDWIPAKTMELAGAFDVITDDAVRFDWEDTAGVVPKASLGRAMDARDKKVSEEYVEHQNTTDKIIRKAILQGKVTRVQFGFDNKKYPGLKHLGLISQFLRSLRNHRLADDFNNLVDLGQLMIIHENDGVNLEKAHAGGVGIYLPDNEDFLNLTTIVHEVFAKSGLDHETNKKIESIFWNWRAGEEMKPEDAALIEEANLEMVNFENRWDYPSQTDLYKNIVDDLDAEAIKRLRGTQQNWYLGIDSSTQSVTFTVIDWATKRVIYKHVETFKDPYYMDKYGTLGGDDAGILPHPDSPDKFVTDPRMIADALDRGMSQLQKDFISTEYGWTVRNIKAISGAAQQHGTVYLNKNGIRVLRRIMKNNGTKGMDGELEKMIFDENIFTNTAPTWRDGRPVKEREEIRTLAGSVRKLFRLTGSDAALRFLGLQAAFFRKENRSQWDATRRVFNIAAWNLALLRGDWNATWDTGDALGTNVAHRTTGHWITRLMPPGLRNKLTPIKPSEHVAGDIGKYWTKYGLAEDTKMVNWTGDNPSGLAGLGIFDEGVTAISWGSSHVAYDYHKKENVKKMDKGEPVGHVFGVTNSNDDRMRLVVFQNGAIALAKIRDRFITDEEAVQKIGPDAGLPDESTKDVAEMDETERELKKKRDEMIDAAKWEIFTELIGDRSKSGPGNKGLVAIPMHKTEDVISIPVPESGAYSNFDLDKADRVQALRAAAEGQMYFMRYMAEQINLKNKNIILTGGASRNPVLRQILADIFNADVHIQKDPDAVSLGSAMRAAKVHQNATWNEAAELAKIEETIKPIPANVAIYDEHYANDFKPVVAKAIAAGEAASASADASDGADDTPGGGDSTGKKMKVSPRPIPQMMEALGLAKLDSTVVEDGYLTFDDDVVNQHGSGHLTEEIVFRRDLVIVSRVFVRESDQEIFEQKITYFPGETRDENTMTFLKRQYASAGGSETSLVEKDYRGRHAWMEVGKRTPEGDPILLFSDMSYAFSQIFFGGVIPFLSEGTPELMAPPTGERRVFRASGIEKQHKEWDKVFNFSEATDDFTLSDLPADVLEALRWDVALFAGMLVKLELGFPWSQRELDSLDKRVDGMLIGPFSDLLQRQLQSGSEAISTFLIERLAIHSVAKSAAGVSREDLSALLAAAEANPSSLVRARARAVRKMVEDDSFEPVELPDVVRNAESSQEDMPTGVTFKHSDARERVLALIAGGGQKKTAASASTARTATLEKHDNASQDFTVGQGEVMVLTAPSKPDGSIGEVKAFRLRGGNTVMTIGQDVYHMVLPLTHDAEWYVDSSNKEPNIEFASLGHVVSDMVIPSDTRLDEAAAEAATSISTTEPVFFISQRFATEERAEELSQEFKGIQFKSFNQDNLEQLHELVKQHPDNKKAFITVGLDYSKIRDLVEAHQSDFQDVMPIPVSGEMPLPERGRELRSFQRGILSLAIIERSLPSENYRGTALYSTAHSLLETYLPEGTDPDQYLSMLLSGDPVARFAYIMDLMLLPIVPENVERLERIIEVLIAA